jgi:hypothetical protein
MAELFDRQLKMVYPARCRSVEVTVQYESVTYCGMEAFARRFDFDSMLEGSFGRRFAELWSRRHNHDEAVGYEYTLNDAMALY